MAVAGRRLIDTVRHAVNVAATMDADDPRPLNPLAAVEREDLDTLSATECDERIVRLRAEIARTERRRAVASAHRSSAADLFRQG